MRGTLGPARGTWHDLVMTAGAPMEDMIAVPRSAIDLPLRLPLPQGFVPQRLETWPRVEGRLEYVEGRLLYTPPSGDEQQDTCIDLAF